MHIDAIILAAGKGTRMKSDRLKVAHHVAGKPIVNYVIDCVDKLGVDSIYLVIGHQAEIIKDTIKHQKMTHVLQKNQLGTGHAVVQVEPLINKSPDRNVLILAGDCPLIEKESLDNLVAIHNKTKSVGTILSVKMDHPAAYGRILRGENGDVIGIKEAKDCSKEELAINEINTGIYLFNTKLLFDSLKKLNTNNQQGEYYLTDIIHILKKESEVVTAYCMDDPNQAVGINTRIDLAKINEILYQKNNKRFMEEGVTIIDPKSTFIDSSVTIGKDTIIAPFTIIEGATTIGENCHIGPHAYIKEGVLSNNSQVAPFSTLIAQ